MTENITKIELPLISVEQRKEALAYAVENFSKLTEAIEKTALPEYLPWDKLKRKNWIPESVGPVGFWVIVKMLRGGMFRTPIQDTEGRYFSWNSYPHYDRLLHELDLNTGGRLVGLDSITEGEKRSYISRGLIEEAIASAQLEGAHTTREVAKKMIEEGRPPKDKSQRMILNNYQTMRLIEENAKNTPLSMEIVLELHTMLTESTLKKPDQVGRLRNDDENIVVGAEDGTIAYIPPMLEFVEKQLPLLIDYANDDLDEGTSFTHPVIKAIIIHFWMGFLHPFADGNGRLARALFYWYLLRNKYWAFSFIPVSTRIKKSPTQYARAYILSEQDDNDLTYFIDYNLRKIKFARDDFAKYIKQKANEYVGLEKLEKTFPDLNYRQLSLMKFLHACPDERTNVTAMNKVYGISSGTAIKDLQILVEKGFLKKKRLGKNVFYYPTSDLIDLTNNALI